MSKSMPITARLQKSPLKQTRLGNALNKGKELANKAKGGDRVDLSNYDAATKAFDNFNPQSDTLFMHTSIDPGAAERGTNHFANVSAGKGASSGYPTEQKMYKGKNDSGQTTYTSVKKYQKK